MSVAKNPTHTFGTNLWVLKQQLDSLVWHETYHLGQIELLRQLAGKDNSLK